MSTSSNQNNFSKGTDLAVIILYMIMVTIGVLCIYMVEYNPNTSWSTSFITAKTNYSKQFYFAIFCSFIGIFILLMDSKVFTALANILYAGGILLMLATFVLGKNINGSKSWIPIAGGFNLQPAELCKIFTALFLAKFISKPETDFTKLKSHLIAGGMIALPAILSIMQHELGLALVYSAFLFAMYREGLPAAILVIGLSFAVLVIAALLLEPTVLAIILTVFE
jgi:rod shape determining protein RodA